ncbi:MAG TPA: nuclear transport factor 2 family protein [Thermoanaerobaculaceae bacterium]|nr:nuclear transport factor 2 family protein [Thermoanaerobaculaceae bacterium]
MTRRVASSVVAAVACLAAAAAQTQPPAAPPPDVAAVATVIGGFMDALNNADIGKFSEFFAPDATMFFPLAPLYLRLENKEQIVKVFTVFFESVRKGKSGPNYMNLSPEDLRIQMYGDTAVATFHFKGTDQISRRTVVLAREKGKWLVVHLHASGMVVPKE